MILLCVNGFSVWWSARGLVKLQRHPAYCILFIHPLCYSWQKEAELFILSFCQKICLTVIFSALAAHGGKCKYIIHLLFQNHLNLPNLSGVLHDSADTFKVVINCLRSNFWSWLHSAEGWKGIFISLSNWNDMRTVCLPLETKCFASTICAESFLFIKALPACSLISLLIKFVLTKLHCSWDDVVCNIHLWCVVLGAEILCQSVWKYTCWWESRPLMKAVCLCLPA